MLVPSFLLLLPLESPINTSTAHVLSDRQIHQLYQFILMKQISNESALAFYTVIARKDPDLPSRQSHTSRPMVLRSRSSTHGQAPILLESLECALKLIGR